MSEFSEIDGLPPSFFEEKRAYFLEKLKRRFAQLNINSILVLQGAKIREKYDSDCPYCYFDQEPCFYWFTGVRLPNFKCVYDITTGQCDLFFEKEDEKEQIWKKIHTKEEIQEKYKMPTHYMDELYPFIQKRNMEKIYLLSGTNAMSGLPVFTADLDFKGELEYLNKRIEHNEYIYYSICECRLLKTKLEQEICKFACKVSVEAHYEMMRTIRPGISQREMENCFNNYCRKQYDQRFFGYGPIACSGRDNAVLHFRNNDRIMEDGELFLSDQGCRAIQYDADISSTFPVNGKFTKEQKDIYDIVLKANRNVINSIKVGETTDYDMEHTSRTTFLGGLKDLGILTPDADIEDLIKKGMWRIFMPCGLGHPCGLDVHDVGRKIPYRSSMICREGMFITVEPGIYFIDMLIQQAKDNPNLAPFINFDMVEKYRHVGGARVEDNIFLFADHVENYTGDLVRTTEEIEEWMEKNNPYCKMRKENEMKKNSGK